MNYYINGVNVKGKSSFAYNRLEQQYLLSSFSITRLLEKDAHLHVLLVGDLTPYPKGLLRDASKIWIENGDARSMADLKPRITEEPNDKLKIWKLTEISESSQGRLLKLLKGWIYNLNGMRLRLLPDKLMGRYSVGVSVFVATSLQLHDIWNRELCYIQRIVFGT